MVLGKVPKIIRFCREMSAVLFYSAKRAHHKHAITSCYNCTCFHTNASAVTSPPLPSHDNHTATATITTYVTKQIIPMRKEWRYSSIHSASTWTEVGGTLHTTAAMHPQ